MVMKRAEFFDVPRTATFGWQGMRAPLLEENKGDPPAGGGTPPPAGDADATKALAAANAKIAELEQKEAARIKGDTDAKTKAEQDKLVADGKFAEALAAKNKEIEAQKPLVDLATSFMAAETARIDGKKAELTDSQRAIVESEPNVVRRGQLLNEFLAVKGVSTGAKPPAPGGTPPPPGDKPDLDKLIAAGMSAEDIQRKHPVEYAAYAASFLPPQRLTSYARQAAASSNGKKA